MIRLGLSAGMMWNIFYHGERRERRVLKLRMDADFFGNRGFLRFALSSPGHTVAVVISTKTGIHWLFVLD